MHAAPAETPPNPAARPASATAASSSPAGSSGAKSTVIASPARQYDEACSTAGPLSPRCVTSSFSRNAGPRAACAVTSAETPANSVQLFSDPPSTSGTSAGRGSTTFNPNCRARSYASPVAPIFGIDSPPVATTSAPALNSPAEHTTRNSPDTALHRNPARIQPNIHPAPLALRQQHVHDLPRRVIAEQLPQRLLVPLDSVALHKFKKMPRLIPRQRRLRKMRILRDESSAACSECW